MMDRELEQFERDPDTSRIIASLSQLKEVKPKEEWVVFTKNKLNSVKNSSGASSLIDKFISVFAQFEQVLRFIEKPAFVMPLLVMLVGGGIVFEYSRNSLPGDTFYSLKTTVDRVVVTFSSQKGNTPIKVGFAQKSLADLRKVAELNKAGNLSPAIEKFESDISEVSIEFARIVENQQENALQAGMGIVQLQKEKARIEKILGTSIGEEQTQELVSLTKILVGNELTDLHNRTLGENQQELLKIAQSAYDAGDYERALGQIWELLNRVE